MQVNSAIYPILINAIYLIFSTTMPFFLNAFKYGIHGGNIPHMGCAYKGRKMKPPQKCAAYRYIAIIFRAGSDRLTVTSSC